MKTAGALLGNELQDFLSSASDTALHANRAGQILCTARALAAASCLSLPPQLLVAGYSVGEMAAWSIAGFWSADQTLHLTARRAELMDAAGGSDDQLGFIHGLRRQAVDNLVKQFDCAIAIVNPNRLYIIGGSRSKVESCCHAAIQNGATSARPIYVEVASHTPRLSSAVKPFLASLQAVPIEKAKQDKSLITASEISIVAGPKSLPALAAQIATTIDWAALLEALIERGIDRVFELGPGTALADMARGAYPHIEVRALDDFSTLAGASKWVCR